MTTNPIQLLRAACLVAALLSGQSASAAAGDLFGGNKPAAGGTCSPTPGGATCGNSGPASQGNSSGTNQGAGNPVNVINGNKYQYEEDMPALPGLLGLEVVRHYNSQYGRSNVPPGIPGRGWKLSYETQLHDIGRSVQIVQADGTRIIFNKSAQDPSLCASEQPDNGLVTIHNANQGQARQYLWRWNDGRELLFNHRGKLTSIALPSGERVQLQYDTKNRLHQVTDPQGRKLRLNYPDPNSQSQHYGGVQSIDSPAGRIEFRYGSELPQGSDQSPSLVRANLVQVHYPGGAQAAAITRQYHYEDARFPTLLTGISISGRDSDGQEQHERIASYGYDSRALAIKSVRGPPGSDQEQVTLDTSKPGQTIVTNSQGQKTIYRHGMVAMQWRLFEVRGAGCASCGPSNMRYRYDQAGHMTEETELDAQGQPLRGRRTQFDSYGRPLVISTVPYTAGRAQPAQWQVRYGYTENPRAQWGPVLIARPSVVAGKEQQTQIRYNAAQQPVEVLETGFSPLDDQGQIASAAQATPIRRTTRYRYARSAGKSLLVEIDGPLPNGIAGNPQDSDITRLQWDPTGTTIRSIEQPGGSSSRIAYDPRTGLITQVTNEQDWQTQFHYNSRGQLLGTRSSGPGWSQPQEESYRYDALGRLIETGQGSLDANATNGYRAQTRQSLDALGRLQWSASAHGVLVQNRYNGRTRTRSARRQ